MVSSNDSENNFKSSAWSFSRLGKFGRRQFYVYSFRERLKIDDELIDRYSTSVVLIKSNSRYKFTRGNLYWIFKYNNYSVKKRKRNIRDSTLYGWHGFRSLYIEHIAVGTSCQCLRVLQLKLKFTSH